MLNKASLLKVPLPIGFGDSCSCLCPFSSSYNCLQQRTWCFLQQLSRLREGKATRELGLRIGFET
uniref:Uncharacterized protein n=1 Tax=Rhizophora mucronata TaxID=61149 RepID=A0A2P2LF48_RHIMU